MLRADYAFSSLKSAEFHSVVPYIDWMRQNIKYLFCKYFSTSFSCLECLQKMFDVCHSWDTLAAVSPPFTTGHQAHIDDVQYAGDHNKSHNTESSDHNAWRPPTGARTTYSTYQSSNWTSDLWNRKSIFELFRRWKLISFVNTARVLSNFLSGQIASIKIIIGPLYPVYKRGIQNTVSNESTKQSMYKRCIQNRRAPIWATSPLTYTCGMESFPALGGGLCGKTLRGSSSIRLIQGIYHIQHLQFKHPSSQVALSALGQLVIS